MINNILSFKKIKLKSEIKSRPITYDAINLETVTNVLVRGFSWPFYKSVVIKHGDKQNILSVVYYK